jgi:hypothetical protein
LAKHQRVVCSPALQSLSSLCSALITRRVCFVCVDIDWQRKSAQLVLQQGPLFGTQLKLVGTLLLVV